MKKKLIYLELFFIILLFYIYFASPYISFYNTEFLHPLFWTLMPLACLLLFCVFLKNINPKLFFLTLIIFGIIDFIILFGIKTTCSQVVCYDRNSSALILSSLFSVIFFIVLFLKNRKQST